MAKTCLNRLTGNIDVDCTLRSYGVKNLYLMLWDDVSLGFNEGKEQVTSITFVEGSKPYRVEGYKQNIQLTAALRSMDSGAKFDVSISFKVPSSIYDSKVLLNRRFYIMVEGTDTSATRPIWGCNSPLECSNVEYDVNANGRLVTYTFTAPEGSAGNYNIIGNADVTAEIISKSI